MHKIKPTSSNVKNLTRSLDNDVQNVQHVQKACSISPSGEKCKTVPLVGHSRLTKHKIHRDYSKIFGKNGDHFKLLQKSKKKHIEICNDCITIKNGRIMKKKEQKQETISEDELLKNEDYDASFRIFETESIPKIKSLIEVNDKIRLEQKVRTAMDRHCINKLNYSRPSFTKKKKKDRPRNKQSKMPRYNPVKRNYSTARIIFPKYEIKKKDHKKSDFKEGTASNKHIHSSYIDKIKGGDKKKKKSKNIQPILKTKKKKGLPLVMIMKETSEKWRSSSNNLVYRVSNNTASFKKVKKSYSDPGFYNVGRPKLQNYNRGVISRQIEQKPLRNEHERGFSKTHTKKIEHFLFTSGKSKGKTSNFYSLNSRSLTIDEDCREKLTKTIRFLLQPVIEQEYMKYYELKSGKNKLSIRYYFVIFTFNIQFSINSKLNLLLFTKRIHIWKFILTTIHSQ